VATNDLARQLPRAALALARIIPLGLVITTRAMLALQQQCEHCYSNVLATPIPSVCPSVRLSVTRRYCVKTAARSTVQFAPLDSKMCPVLYKPKNIPQGRPLPPEILAQIDLHTPEGCEF